MNDFFKYLTPSEEDRRWGIYLNVAGKVRILPGKTPYPSGEHPPDYFFTWQRGRVLQEFQLNYITRGRGTYETASARHSVREGMLMVTLPGVWHRYRPAVSTGWTENYVGFDGPIPGESLQLPGTLRHRPVIDVGIREDIIGAYHELFELVREERPGFQQVASGMVMKILGYMVSAEKQKNFAGKRVERIIRRACFEMRENTGGAIDFREYAGRHHIGYSYFRKMFRQYTGTSPLQYHLDLKIRKAREMLVATDASVKEIAFETGFQSIHYFSRTFRKRTGISPSEVRRRL